MFSSTWRMFRRLMHCPICQAIVEQGPTCRRCKADLSLIIALDRQRQRLLQDARLKAVEGNLGEAHTLAAVSQTLHPTAEGYRILALCHLLRRDFAKAWKAYLASGQAPAL